MLELCCVLNQIQVVVNLLTYTDIYRYTGQLYQPRVEPCTAWTVVPRLHLTIFRRSSTKWLCKVCSTSMPSYLRSLDWEPGHNLQSATTTLCQPSTTTFAKCAFRRSTRAVWNSLPKTVLNIIITIKDIYIAQVCKGHKCAMLAEIEVLLSNCLCLYSYLYN